MILAVLCVTFSALALAFAFGERGVKYAGAEDVAAGEWFFVGDGLDDAYYRDEDLNVPVKKVVVEENEYDSVYTVIFPSGKAFSGATVTLSESGIYRIHYVAAVSGVNYYNEENFTVLADNYEFKDVNCGSTAVYGTYTGHGQAGKDGLMVRLHKDDALVFNKVIKISELNPSKAIAEFFPTPDIIGAYECAGVIFKLIDTKDPSVYVEFDVHGNVTFTAGHRYSWMTVAGNGQKSYGYENGKGYHYRDNWGTPIDGVSFRAQTNVNQSGNASWSGGLAPLVPGNSTARVCYDPIEMIAYANASYCNDLNDPTVYGDEIWGGFVSDYARLEIRIDGAVGTYANFVLVDVFGVELDNRDRENIVLTDDVPPLVTIEKVFEEMPKAEVGKKYAYPAASAFDAIFGPCDVSVGVKYNYAVDPIDITVGDGYFIPDMVGDYVIAYTATDAYGNEGLATLIITAYETLDPFTITPPAEILALDGEEMPLGKKISVGSASVTGGAGGYTLVTTYSIEGGDPIIVDGDIIPETEGLYTVTYKVTDYVGNEGAFSVSFTGVATDEIIVNDSISLDKVYISEIRYVLPVLTGYNYADNKAEVKATVQVIDKNGASEYVSGDEFMPEVENNGDTITVKYMFGDEVYEEFTVPVIIGKYYRANGNLADGMVRMQNYFYGDKIATSFRNSAGIKYDTGIEISITETTEEAGWVFANALVADGVNIGVSGIKDDLGKIANLQFILTDAKDATKSVTVDLAFSATRVVVTNGTEELSYDYSSRSFFDGNEYFLKYSGGRFYFANAAIKLRTFDDGTPFDGFPSSLVYLSLKNVKSGTKMVTAGTKYIVTSVWESIISSDCKDSRAPSYSVSEDIAGARNLGGKISIPSAVCRDVFNPNSDVLVTVKDASGAIITSDDGIYLNKVEADRAYEISLNKVGNYSVIYTTKELYWNHNEKDNVVSFEVVDNVKPVARFASTPKTTAKRGEIISFPDIIATDNVTAQENIRIVRAVIASGGKVIVFSEGYTAFKPLYTGEYEFVALVKDEASNFVSLRFVVTVTE